MTTITAKSKEHPEKVSVEYDLPESLSELVAKFGEETVAEAAFSRFVIRLQDLMRKNIGKSAEELQALVTAWRPDVRTPSVKKSAFERASSALNAMSPEEQQELFNRLKAQMKASR